MEKKTEVSEEIFPKGTNKSYALVELVKGKSPMVGKGPDDTVFSFPIVLLWEIILLLGVTLGLFLFSLLRQAPLDEIANPLITTDPAKAPWYFVGLQELLEHMHPTLAGIIIPTVLVVFLFSIPYLDFERQDIGLWFSSAKGKRLAVWTSIYTLVVMPTYILLDNAFPLREIMRENVPQWVAQGLLPALILFILIAVPTIVVRFRKGTRREIMIVLFTIMFVAAIVFTISGFLFRGPGFKLFWPWEMPGGYNPWADF